MEVFEITGFQTGVSEEGVNYLQPSDSFQNIENGYIHRQVLYSRKGFRRFSTGRLADGGRVLGLFEFIKNDNTTETLAITEDYLYTYNEGTDTFDQVPMAGSAPAGGFGIGGKGDYVSGTTYLDKAGAERFIFTSKGLTDVWYYDGTDVRSFTKDNLDFQHPIAGSLTNAWYVIAFGERLNFFNPTVGGTPQPQAVLYSGIKDTSGNGDKFAAVGSGQLSADTSDYITGATVLGNSIIINMNRSNWVLEKTRDAFNPYFIRRVPTRAGTDAPFSAVAWDDKVRSLGKTGIIATDARDSKRVDNKIPNFIDDEADETNFDLIWGGYDRDLGQFLWTYKSDESDPDTITQDKILVNNYEENSWSTYDMRMTVFSETYNGPVYTWDQIDETIDPAWEQWDTTEDIWDKIGILDENHKVLAGDDEGFVYAMNQDHDDYSASISAITQAASAVLTVSASAFKVGDRVIVYDVEGMTEINNFDPADDTAAITPYTVTAATNTSVTVNVDSADFTAYTTGGVLEKLISFRAETVPFNPYRAQGRRVYVSHVEFLIDSNAGYLYVDVIADEEETPFKENVLLLPGASAKRRQWVTLGVNQEADFITMVLRQESPSRQLRLTNIRIHAAPGGLSNG